MDEVISFREPKTVDDYLVEKYIKAEQERIDELEKKYFREEQENFVDKLVGAFYQMDPRMSIDLANTGATNLLSSCCPRIEIHTYYERPLMISQMDLLFAESGDSKTMILEKVREYCKKFGLLIMESYSVEGLCDWFAELKNEKDPTLGYEHEPYGTMVIDEISSLVVESETKTHMKGVLEALATLYNRRLPSKKLVSHFREPQEPIDVSILGATVPSTITLLPVRLFQQGFAGRFNWTYIEPRPYPEKDIPIAEIRHSIKVKKDIGELAEKLEELSKICTTTRDNVITLENTNEVTKIWNNYARERHEYWLSEYKTTPQRFHFQYAKRCAEMAIKEAGRIAIGRQIDIIIAQNGFQNIKINAEDMQRGIQRMRKSTKQIKEITDIRADALTDKEIGLVKPTTINTMYYVLLGLPNSTATMEQWKTACKMNKNPTTFTKYKDELMKQGLVVLLDKNTITDEEEKSRLRVHTGTKIVRAIVKKM